jgi:hypothetical protein
MDKKTVKGLAVGFILGLALCAAVVGRYDYPEDWGGKARIDRWTGNVEVWARNPVTHESRWIER